MERKVIRWKTRKIQLHIQRKIQVVDMLLERMRGGLYGFAVGDLLEWPADACGQSAAKMRQEPCGCDASECALCAVPAYASLTLATMDSLCRGFDLEDLVRRFSLGWRPGTPSAAEQGQSALTRVLPLAFFLFPSAGTEVARSPCAMERIHAVSALTGARTEILVACGLYVCITCGLLAGQEAEQAVRQGVLSAMRYYLEYEDAHFQRELWRWVEMADTQTFSGRPPDAALDGMDAFGTAVHCLLCTRSYPACVQKAARLGGRPAAAVAGSLAGIAYGESGIPARWRICIPQRGEMDRLCVKMYAFCSLYA